MLNVFVENWNFSCVDCISFENAFRILKLSMSCQYSSRHLDNNWQMVSDEPPCSPQIAVLFYLAKRHLFRRRAMNRQCSAHAFYIVSQKSYLLLNPCSKCALRKQPHHYRANLFYRKRWALHTSAEFWLRTERLHEKHLHKFSDWIALMYMLFSCRQLVLVWSERTFQTSLARLECSILLQY